MLDQAWGFILLFVLVCLGVNIIMYLIGWYGYGKHGQYSRNKYLPPGFLIGVVWIGIFAALGYSFYLAYSGDSITDPITGDVTKTNKWNRACYLIIVVSAYCLIYPILTMFVPEKYVPLLNLIALLMAAALSIVVISERLSAFWYTLPLLAWTAYVNFADVMQYGDFLEKYGLVQPGMPIKNL
jgi:tryptophan-rich sensory protein